MKKVLIIVDPQKDFIDGSLKVPDAMTKMDELSNYIKLGNYDRVIVTLDWHPSDHCSFKENGGEWPSHCVLYTEGCLPHKNLWQVLIQKFKMNKNLFVVKKGCNSEVEEYGALDRPTNSTYINKLVENCDEIDIAGIMSEYCVLNTVKGMVKSGLESKILLLLPYISTMDNHQSLINYAKENNLKFSI